jgi:ABC-2 type transport system ATP-binding protein
MIQVRAVSKSFGSISACKNISLEAKQGEIVALLGPNGAGKSTIIKMLAGIIAPTSGTVSICGFDLSTDAEEAKRRSGYVFEGAPLYADMTVAESISFVAGMHGLGRNASQIAAECTIERCNLGDVSGRIIGNLSKGFRQRTALALALVHDPQVLVLDEPSSGLDPVQLDGFRDIIRTIAPEKTIIFSTHVMQEVESLCTRAVMIDGGSIIADGSIADICASTGMNGIEEAFLALVRVQNGSRP